MSDFDLTKLPTGERGWAALLAYATEADDRVERYFLEVKSDVDLNAKRDRAKVAKFILGAANRDPAKAARRLGGHAVMLLGVGKGSAPGIPGFEAMELAREVTKFLGTDGPDWDFDRIPTSDANDVIAIVVAPPTGAVWTCRADGDGLCDGDIYVRADGETRKAKGDEIRSMLERATAPTRPTIAVEVAIIGEVAAVRVDDELLINAIQDEAAALLARLAPQPKPAGSLSSMLALASAASLGTDTRTKREFRAEVEEWQRKALLNPTYGVIETVGRVRPGVQLRVTNRSRVFLRDVRIDVDIDAPVVATAWEEPAKNQPIDLLPGAPPDWGSHTISALMIPRGVAGIPRNRHGILRIVQHRPCRLTLSLDSLRPEEVFTGDNDEVVLLAFAEAALIEPVAARWRMTADGVNEIYEGEFTISSVFFDMRDTIARILAPSGYECSPSGSEPPTDGALQRQLRPAP